MDDCYQLVNHRSNFDYKTSHFNSLYQHKIHLIHADTLCADELEATITYK